MGTGHKQQRVKNIVWLNVERWGESGGWYITYGNQSGQNNVWSLTTASETQRVEDGGGDMVNGA